MNIEPFEMERYQSLWENVVEYNLSESGVHPLKINQLISSEHQDKFLNIQIGYNQTNGSPELRTIIANMYENAKVENVLVTTGSSEANFLTIFRMIEPGDEIAFMLPNYMQMWGVARAMEGNIKSFHLIPDNNRWQIDWDEFEKAVSKNTKLIIICNPNNPTGAQLNIDDIQRICETAKKFDAWILADEVYRGAEREGGITPTFWGQYEKVIVSCGLSKAYGLPGLRIGWVLATPPIIEELWKCHDYTSICPNPISDQLAQIALQPSVRQKIIERTQKIVSMNFETLHQWLNTQGELFSCIPPVAGAITFIKQNLPLSSNEFVTRLRDEKSVLVVPGEQFLMDKYLRIGFGCQTSYLKAALNRVSKLIEDLV